MLHVEDDVAFVQLDDVARTFELRLKTLGLLESLVLEPQVPPTPQHPASGQVDLLVQATGLNFRDVTGMTPASCVFGHGSVT